jgi:hypothetical protein
MSTEAAPQDSGVAPGVDQASPNALERRNSLEKHLQLRPDEKDLKDRHILLDTTAAPALQARQAELERQRITDNLKKVSSIRRVRRPRDLTRNHRVGSLVPSRQRSAHPAQHPPALERRAGHPGAAEGVGEAHACRPLGEIAAGAS